MPCTAPPLSVYTTCSSQDSVCFKSGSTHSNLLKRRKVYGNHESAGLRPPSVCSVRDVPMPVCGEDEVVIKVMAASICKGADRRHHTTGHKLGRYPITTGHEFAGYIYQVGSAVTGWNVGDRVTADNAVPCGKCYFCQQEMYAHCLNFQSVGHSTPAICPVLKSKGQDRVPDSGPPLLQRGLYDRTCCLLHSRHGSP